MRVLHITSGNLYGGVETFLTTLLREASAAPGMRPEFAICFDGRFRSEVESLGGSTHPLEPARLSRPHTVLRARRSLAALVRRESFDVVVCHQPWICVLFASVIRAADLPVVLWVHMAGEGRHWLERLCRLTRPDVVVCNSRFAATQTARWLRSSRIEHVYYPVSVRRSDDGAQPLKLRAECDTPAGDVVIAQISRLEAWKGQHVLLSALATLRDVPGWTCWLVGGAQKPDEARYLDELKALARATGIESRIRFLGERRDVPAVLDAADVFCQPNTSPEPFGIALVEAQQARLPVVTSGLGGALEIVDGECGVLTEPGAVNALADGLRRLILDRDVRTRLGIQSRRRADELCNAPRQIRRIEALLATALRSPRVTQHRAIEADLRRS